MKTKKIIECRNVKKEKRKKEITLHLSNGLSQWTSGLALGIVCSPSSRIRFQDFIYKGVFSLSVELMFKKKKNKRKKIALHFI